MSSAPPSETQNLLLNSEQQRIEEAQPRQAHGSETNRQNFRTRADSVFFNVGLMSVLMTIWFVVYAVGDSQHTSFTGVLVYAGYCAFMSVVLTGVMGYSHLLTYTSPNQQRLIFRILIFVPILAVDSFFALLFGRKAMPAVNVMMNTYQSYVVYNWFQLMMSYIGGKRRLFGPGSKPRIVVRSRPLSWFLYDYRFTPKILRRWEFFIFQFTVLNPLLTLVTEAAVLAGHFDPNNYSPASPNLWIMIVLNTSMTIAFIAIYNFRVEFKKELRRHDKNATKAFVVENLLFLTFYQGVVLQVLAAMGYVKPSGAWTEDQVQAGVQSFLLCIEMLATCYLVRGVFSEDPYLVQLQSLENDTTSLGKGGAEGVEGGDDDEESEEQPLLYDAKVKPESVCHILSIHDVIDDTVASFQKCCSCCCCCCSPDLNEEGEYEDVHTTADAEGEACFRWKQVVNFV